MLVKDLAIPQTQKADTLLSMSSEFHRAICFTKSDSPEEYAATFLAESLFIPIYISSGTLDMYAEKCFLFLKSDLSKLSLDSQQRNVYFWQEGDTLKYTSFIGCGDSIEEQNGELLDIQIKEELTQDYLQKNRIAILASLRRNGHYFDPYENISDSMKVIVDTIAKSPLGKQYKRIIIYSNLQIAFAPQDELKIIPIINLRLSDVDYIKFHQLSLLAFCSGDKTLELAISTGAVPIYISPMWKKFCFTDSELIPALEKPLQDIIKEMHLQKVVYKEIDVCKLQFTSDLIDTWHKTRAKLIANSFFPKILKILPTVMAAPIESIAAPAASVAPVAPAIVSGRRQNSFLSQFWNFWKQTSDGHEALHTPTEPSKKGGDKPAPSGPHTNLK